MSEATAEELLAAQEAVSANPTGATTELQSLFAAIEGDAVGALNASDMLASLAESSPEAFTEPGIAHELVGLLFVNADPQVRQNILHTGIVLYRADCLPKESLVELLTEGTRAQQDVLGSIDRRDELYSLGTAFTGWEEFIRAGIEVPEVVFERVQQLFDIEDLTLRITLIDVLHAIAVQESEFHSESVEMLCTVATASMGAPTVNEQATLALAAVTTQSTLPDSAPVREVLVENPKRLSQLKLIPHNERRINDALDTFENS